MATIREELELIDKFSIPLTRFEKLIQNSARQMDMLQASLSNVETATASAALSLRDMATQTDKNKSKGKELGDTLKRIVGAMLSIQTVKALVNMSDQITQTTARLDMMNDGLQTTEELNQMIYDSAMRSRGSYAETADMVAKLGVLAGDAFGSSAEIVAFAEQLNKQFVLSGTSAQGIQAAMLQLTQAMSSGVLRGEELNSVLDQAPLIAQSIADYLDVTVGEMRELAAEGQITAGVVKNAMFAAADETNAKFESMPMTWAQVWTQVQNILVQALQPVLTAISWVANHMEQLTPILVGVAGGALAYAAALAIQTAATWIADGAAKAFFTTLLANPLTWIVLIIGLVIAAIAKWVQSIGGLKVAWLTVVDAILFAWDTVKAGFMTGVYWVMNLFDQLSLKFKSIGVTIADAIGTMKVTVLTILQSLVNGAIGIINWFIDKLNMIPGVSINKIQETTFATTAAAEEAAASQARHAELEAARAEADALAEERANNLANMWAERDANHAQRQAEIQAAKAANASETSEEMASDTSKIASDTKAIKKSVSMADEDLKSLVDMAERQYVNNINLTAQTPVINITGQNTGHTAADRQNLANTIRDILIEQVASGSTRTTARAF